MKVITIGGGMQDVFLSLQSADILRLQTHDCDKTFLVFEEGHKVEIDFLQYTIGGGAVNSAVSFARQGFETTIMCKIGTDNSGQYIVNRLQDENVICSSVIQTDSYQTGRSFIIPCPSGDRVVLLDRGASTTLTRNDLHFGPIEQSDVTYITSLSKNASESLPFITKAAKLNNKYVVCNPGTSQLTVGAEMLGSCLPNIDILILNSHEAQLLMVALVEQKRLMRRIRDPQRIERDSNLPKLLQQPITYANICFDLVTFFKTVLHNGPQIVVVTDGADGVYVCTQNQLLFHPSMPPKKMGNTLGAGDAFGSAFVGSLAHGVSLDKALIRGILNSTSVIEHLDTLTGLLDANTLTLLSEQQEFYVVSVPFS